MATRERSTGDPIWLELLTTDFARSSAFYEGLFGWTPDAVPETFDGGTTMHLGEARVARLVPMPDDGWVVYLATPDAAATAAAVPAHGGRVELAPSDVRDLAAMTIAVDPSGARVGFWQPRAHPGFEAEDVPGSATWFELHTDDFAAAVPFYEAVAGWRSVSLGDSDGFRMVANGPAGDARAGIYDARRDGLAPGSMWMPYFAVEDADAAAARVRELGGSMLDDPVDTPFGRLAHAVDPLGTLFTVLQLPERRA